MKNITTIDKDTKNGPEGLKKLAVTWTSVNADRYNTIASVGYVVTEIKQFLTL